MIERIHVAFSIIHPSCLPSCCGRRRLVNMFTPLCFRFSAGAFLTTSCSESGLLRTGYLHADLLRGKVPCNILTFPPFALCCPEISSHFVVLPPFVYEKVAEAYNTTRPDCRTYIETAPVAEAASWESQYVYCRVEWVAIHIR